MTFREPLGSNEEDEVLVVENEHTFEPSALSQHSLVSAYAHSNPADIPHFLSNIISNNKYESVVQEDSLTEKHNQTPESEIPTNAIAVDTLQNITVDDTYKHPELLMSVYERWKREIREIWGIFAPACLGNMLMYSFFFVDNVFVGHQGPDAMAAGGVGLVLFNLGNMFGWGLTTALDTLASQSFGAGNEAAARVWAKRTALYIGAFSCCFMAVLWWPRWWFVLFLRGNASAIDLGVSFCRWISPSLPFFQLFQVQTTYLRAKNIFSPPVWVQGFASILNVFFNALFIYGFHMGLVGSPLATTVSNAIKLLGMQFIIIHVYNKGMTIEDVLRGFSSKFKQIPTEGAVSATMSDSALLGIAMAIPRFLLLATKFLLRQARPKQIIANIYRILRLTFQIPIVLFHIAAYGPREVIAMCHDDTSMSFPAAKVWLKLAIPGAVMIVFEGSAFDVVGIMAATQGTIYVDAHTAALTFTAGAYMIWAMQFSIAASVRVGQALGAGKPEAARFTGIVCRVLATCGMVIPSIGFLVFHDSVGYIFSDDARVIDIVGQLMPIAALYELADALQGASAGAGRGCGMQHVIAVINIVGLIIIGLMLSYILGFVAHAGVVGMWWGLTIGLYSCAALHTVVLWRVDWQKMSDQAVARVHIESLHQAAAAELSDTVKESSLDIVV